MAVISRCNRIIRWSYYLLFILVPLILTPWNYELFEYNKIMVTYGLTVVIMTAWIIKSISERTCTIARTPLDIPIALFLGSQLVSSLFSMDPHVSWFGYYSRFNGGMLSLFSYSLLYYGFVSNIRESSIENRGWQSEHRASGMENRKTANKSDTQSSFTLSPEGSLDTRYIYRLLKVMCFTGAVVAFYGVLERMGIDKHLWVQDVQNRVFSTLGQPNWLAAYLGALAPITMALGLTSIEYRVSSIKKKVAKTLNMGFLWWAAISFLFFVVTLFTRSRSGLLAFAVADTLFWLFALFPKPTRRTRLFPFFVLHAAFVIFVFLNGTYIHQIDTWVTWEGLAARLAPQQATLPQEPTPEATLTPTRPGTAALMDAGITESGTIRSYVWQGAVRAWQHSMKTLLIGTGTETFAFAFFQNRPAGHNMTSEWDFLYNKAHNEYLNYLTTTGSIGLGTYTMLLVIFGLWFIQTQNSKVKGQSNVKIQNESQNTKFQTQTEHTFDFSLLSFALFSGWVSILVTNFFGFSVVIVQLFLFLFPAFIFLLHEPATHARVAHLGFPHGARTSLTFMTLLVGLAGLVGLFLVWQADVLFAKGYRANRSGAYGDARNALIAAISQNPTEPLYYDELATSYAGLTTQAVEVRDATGAGEFLEQSIVASTHAVTGSPNNVNFWKTRTKIFFALSESNPTFTKEAIESLEKAQTLSPNDPKIYYNLAVLEGRLGRNDRAIEHLRTATALKPNYRDAYYALYLFYVETNKPTESRGILTDYLTRVDPSDGPFKALLEK